MLAINPLLHKEKRKEKRLIVSWVGKGEPRLLLALVRPCLEFCMLFWAVQYEKHGHTRENPTKRHKGDNGTGASHIKEKERLRQLGLFRLEKAQEDLTNTWGLLQK